MNSRIVETQKCSASGIWRTITYNLDTARDRARYIARERYAFPGGYELLAVTNDGALLCSQCVIDNFRLCLESARDYQNDIYADGWRVDAIALSDELENFEQCSHCNKMIDGYHLEESESEKPQCTGELFYTGQCILLSGHAGQCIDDCDVKFDGVS
jgi:hypothetical protein